MLCFVTSQDAVLAIADFTGLGRGVGVGIRSSRAVGGASVGSSRNGSCSGSFGLGSDTYSSVRCSIGTISWSGICIGRAFDFSIGFETVSNCTFCTRPGTVIVSVTAFIDAGIGGSDNFRGGRIIGDFSYQFVFFGCTFVDT
jgi:hypothetical protein